MSKTPRKAKTLADLFDWRDDLVKLLGQAQSLGVCSPALVRDITDSDERIESEIKKHLAPFEGTPKVVRHGDGSIYTWADHGNMSWNGLRRIWILDTQDVALDKEFTL